MSFTTTLVIAVERGITVFPHRWKDERAGAYAAARDAVLAVGRLEARELAGREGGGISLSPAAMALVDGVDRIVLPSPNGSTICFALAGTGSQVVAASLRNASAVASTSRRCCARGRRVRSSPRVSAGRTGPCARPSRTSGVRAR